MSRGAGDQMHAEHLVERGEVDRDVLGRAALDLDSKREQRLVAEGGEIGDCDHAHGAGLLEPPDARARRSPRRSSRSCAICWLVARPFFFRSATIRSSISSSVGRLGEVDARHLPAYFNRTRTPGFVVV